MKICHLCLNGPYNEGWNYQENILPKYHAKQGNEVYQIVTPYMWEGTEQVLSSDIRYKNDSGVEIIRCKVKKGIVGGTRFNRYPEVRFLLEEIAPQIIFIHDVQFLDIMVVSRYLKENPQCIAYADNHSDFSNSAQNWFSKKILHEFLWKKMAKRVEPYIKKFYGVLPARVDFLVDMYGIPREKCELLVMGADDELVEKTENPEVRQAIRKKYHIRDEDFLIMTGGKINRFRPETLDLMRAVGEIKHENVKLLIFGMVEETLKKEFDSLCEDKKIIYVGWQDSSKTYDFFAAADLVIFPGLHSVMWEQVVAQGIPCVFRKIEGFDHVDIGGNAHFIENVNVKNLKKEIENILEDPLEYQHMKKVAKDKGMKVFSYREIAKKSIGLN